ncbi:alanyl-tRNA synthetase [Geobacter metallireducens RCH3]|uniref:Alanine--tRNA ligase n=1 Tax=Geobacter metallireducens (strain ATCC 53774 / DSM 7210 / GS-15) TaxID=269799 RepID=SYA_GEOMG|nr:alanine--tRNA ligase [Geobacter metallireducens]Q39Z77.1 RecName: Full=Alanine--tRNA ligase; AltName: Full=Alanyl-tRNA synthetase; Short=AlaRS [Geobacter metallireducens GS-15]ABB30447.1 alanyl-tRNA synthetase [Geobacter metallireducens GS-15]EHP87324.1 alanyl-tRNA synthetase [Geobacter metallireducens RCH3]
MTGNELRARFLKFFEDRGHTVVPSSLLIPHNDPTLLFANAGMNQFKDCFLGMEDRGYTRATSSQKCVRAGGKHNDLENVGRTARHHTFFEMLGNFSFGDYFKKEAIAFAWEFLTKDLGLDKDRLYVTVYTDDDEAADIWHHQEGVPRERIFRFGEKDNFWSMGDTGPCGPCSEIFWDNGPEVGCGSPDCTVGCDCDRYMEIWNNVFMQFNRSADGTMTPLPKPSVDTGMGLERICTVMQGVKSNYDTDLLQGVIRHVERLSGKRYRENEKDDVSMRVIADHARATTFLICDGVLPSNEGRGYVLRRIMRRAARHAKMLGFAEPVLYRTVDAVNEMMGGSYPELLEREEYIKKVIRAEEERFAETLDRGLAILNDAVAQLKGEGKTVIPGETLFRLYDTFGFPTDLTADIVRAEGFTIDEPGFEACMGRQREQAREHWKGSGEEGIAAVHKELHNRGVRSVFVGYDEKCSYAAIGSILRGGSEVAEAKAGEDVEIITDRTPFYGESGGQAGDTGTISTGSAHVRVTGTIRPYPDLIVHRGTVVEGTIKTGEACDLKVASVDRDATARNHTATHLLQTALRRVLGEHVKQAGSLVAPDRLRFDFTHFAAMTPEEIRRVEEIVNTFIMENDTVHAREMAVEEAMESGATALFGEKYGDRVRVVKVGEVSAELCGGTHVRAAGDIGSFKILSEAGIAAGVRRIEALTGMGALRHIQELEDEKRQIAALMKAEGGDNIDRLQKLLARQREMQREIETLQGQLNAAKSGDLLADVREVNGVKVLATKVEVDDPKKLRELADTLKDRLGSGVVALGCEKDGRANLLVAVTKDLAGRIRAGDIIRQLAPVIGGSGGGKPELAQAGGSQPDMLAEALGKVYGLIG